MKDGLGRKIMTNLVARRPETFRYMADDSWIDKKAKWAKETKNVYKGDILNLKAIKISQKQIELRMKRTYWKIILMQISLKKIAKNS